jgi:hypothetical protein
MSFNHKVRRSQAEKFFILDGVMYRMNGKPVTLASEDEKYRTAYRDLATRMGNFCPDGFYVFRKNKFKALPFRGSEQDLSIALNVLGDNLEIPR